MRLCKYLFVSCLTLLSLPGHAEVLSGLYQVREPVSSQTPTDRDQATQHALETLVLRLTGDPKAFQGPGLAALRKNPQQIISQYGYEAGPPQSLLVDFDPGSTERVLHQAGLSLWGSNRPAILVWWLSDSPEGSSLVGDGLSSAAPLRYAAQHRGLPLRLPLADLGEQLVGTAKNLEGSDPVPLRSASERYNADALLAVHATQNGDKWQAKWRLWLGDQHEQGAVEGADTAALADAVMLAVSERLAPRFVGASGASSEMLLEVQGVTLDRYAALGRLLEPFGGRVKSVDGSTVIYQVTGSADQLRAQLGLAKLQEIPAEVPGAPVAVNPGAAPGSAPIPQPKSVAALRFHY